MTGIGLLSLTLPALVILTKYAELYTLVVAAVKELMVDLF